MKILTSLKTDDWVPFNTLEYGESFTSKNKYYIKTSAYRQAVNIVNGLSLLFEDNELVKKVTAVVHIKE